MQQTYNLFIKMHSYIQIRISLFGYLVARKKNLVSVVCFVILFLDKCIYTTLQVHGSPIQLYYNMHYLEPQPKISSFVE